MQYTENINGSETFDFSTLSIRSSTNNKTHQGSYCQHWEWWSAGNLTKPQLDAVSTYWCHTRFWYTQMTHPEDSPKFCNLLGVGRGW